MFFIEYVRSNFIFQNYKWLCISNYIKVDTIARFFKQTPTNKRVVICENRCTIRLKNSGYKY